MRKIYKYEMPITEQEILIQLPFRAKIVKVGSMGQFPYINFWAEFEESEDFEERIFRVFGTGVSIPEEYNYVGTTIQDNLFVWHLYEL